MSVAHLPGSAVVQAASSGIRLDLTWVDYLMIIVYFGVVIGIGFIARSRVKSSMDFFLSGRSLPAWITGLAFISANLGATEILGMAANGAQIGMSTLHYYLIGAVPAMVFLGLVMMPFYYALQGAQRAGVHAAALRQGAARRQRARVRRLDVLIAGINLFAMAIVIEAMLGWPQWLAIVVSAAFVLAYITLGGLSSAIYNEVMQFFVIVAGLVPLTIVGLNRVHGWNGLTAALEKSESGKLLHAWAGTSIGDVTNPIGADWLAIVLGLGFVLSFGYWTTNFTEVQRAFSAKNMSAARRTPLIGALPKLFIPIITVIPGLIAAAVLGKALSGAGGSGLTYNDVIPKLMQMYLPSGVLGVAVTGLLASFMAGMAANVSSFNTVFTYDIWQRYIKRGPLRRPLPAGRPVGHGDRRARRHRDRVPRRGRAEPDDLPADAVLVLQRAPVRRLHHRPALEADDDRRRALVLHRRHPRAHRGRSSRTRSASRTRRRSSPRRPPRRSTAR